MVNIMIGRERYQKMGKTGQALNILPEYGRKRLLDYADSFRDIARAYLQEHGRTDAEEYIARAVERNGWEWKKDDWLCHLISDGKRFT